MNRYPGIRPFRTDERHLFFGRSDDVERLYRLLRLEQLVVLYGKSGYGKSSLLSAGVYPKLAEEGRYAFWEVRFGPHRPGIPVTPADVVRANVGQGSGGAQLPVASIWQALKNQQTPDSQRFILFFDQFEEIFSYPPEQVADFKQQLAEALFSTLPDHVRVAARSLDPVARTLLYEPFELKVVFSIRSDRMSLLKQLEDYLPNVLRHAFQLEALDEKQAADAVTRPASLPQFPETGEPFATPPFSYAPETLSAIFRELRDESGRIETSALQIVCKYVENNIVSPRVSAPEGGGPALTVTASDLGDLKTVFRAFYDQTIAALDGPQQPVARRLIEDLLIKDGIRLPFAEQALLTQPGVTEPLLEKLEKSSLLRVELDAQRRKIYEVGHDTLVAPIVEAAQTRRAEEERLRLQEEADQQRREKEKAVAARRRARLVALGAVTLALVAITALVWALWQQAALRRTTGQVVESILDDAAERIRELKYDEAWEKMGDAGRLGEQKVKTARALLEIAYFYNETGQTPKAVTAARQAAGMYEKNATAAVPAPSGTGQPAWQTLREALRALDSQRFSELEARYYPLMIAVRGGAFGMGRDTARDQEGDPDELPSHPVHLTDYEIAQTETTFWQYGLFTAATGGKISDISPDWGIDGNNPVVKVSWLDACRYANWLSSRFGRDTAYILTGNAFLPDTDARSAYALPTEAEWEYAARDGNHPAGFLYAGSDSPDSVAWYFENSLVNGVRSSRPVRTKAPNDRQLFDMSGNVWEWCQDWYGAYPAASTTPATNPSGPVNGTDKVLRGGSWNEFPAKSCCVSNRFATYPDNRSNHWGFRLVRH